MKEKLKDRHWRLNNLYYIKDKSGKKIKFQCNWAQLDLYSNLHYFNVILKARQLGFTTFIMIYFLDACLFNSNHSAGVIAHTLDDAMKIFKEKVKFAYDNLPEWLKDARGAKSDSARTLEFDNGSSIYVGTSLRSGTYQKLLVSEYGKLSAKYPEKAREVKTGALNTIEAGQQIFIESTAEGKVGEFYTVCEQARKLKDSGRELARIEPKFFFYAWWQNPDYVASAEETKRVTIKAELQEYFEELEKRNIKLSKEQKAWYVLKEAQQGEDIRQEYPSLPEEAFQGSLKGAFYTEEMKYLRASNRFRKGLYDPRHGVYTYWDLGHNDLMTCLFYQFIDGQHRFIDYHEANNEGWAYYANMLQRKGYNYIRHYFPHDGNRRMRGAVLQSDREVAQGQGIRPIEVTNRTKDVWKDIQQHCKPMLRQTWWDEERCAQIILHLDNYRKKWSKADSMYMQEAVHDDASHGCDAFRTWAVNPKVEAIEDDGPEDDDIIDTGGTWMG